MSRNGAISAASLFRNNQGRSERRRLATILASPCRSLALNPNLIGSISFDVARCSRATFRTIVRYSSFVLRLSSLMSSQYRGYFLTRKIYISRTFERRFFLFSFLRITSRTFSKFPYLPISIDRAINIFVITIWYIERVSKLIVTTITRWYATLSMPRIRSGNERSTHNNVTVPAA